MEIYSINVSIVFLIIFLSTQFHNSHQNRGAMLKMNNMYMGFWNKPF
jgi:hypothetical protein